VQLVKVLHSHKSVHYNEDLSPLGYLANSTDEQLLTFRVLVLLLFSVSRNLWLLDPDKSR